MVSQCQLKNMERFYLFIFVCDCVQMPPGVGSLHLPYGVLGTEFKLSEWVGRPLGWLLSVFKVSAKVSVQYVILTL